MGRGRRWAAVLAAAWLAGCATPPDAGAPRQVARFSEGRPGEAFPGGWRPWTLSRFKRATRYRLVARDDRIVVRASARAAASGLIHPLGLDPHAHPVLSWRWKVDELIALADNSNPRAEDSPVRVVVSFDGDMNRLPAGERLFRDHFRLISGQALPYATLMYIWENRAPRETLIANRHTGRVKMIVVESGSERLGRWQEVTRNVRDDYRRAFGEEPGRITAIGIMTDSDNTGADVHAYYGDIAFRAAAVPTLARD